MPLTSYGGDGGSDWLQSLLANYGASRPYGPGGAPSYDPGSGGAMPGGAELPGSVGRGIYPYTSTTPGGPSLGYPAMGQPSPQAPAQAPSLQTAAPDYGPGSQRAALNQTLNPGSPQAYPPWPTPPAPSAGVLTPPAPPAGLLAGGGIGSDANFPVIGAGGFPTTYAAPGQQPPTVSASTAATHANAPPGNPSATPRPARRGGASGAAPAAAASASNPRFGTVQYQVPNSSGGPLSRNPIYTTLNLFGGGQPAAAPAVNANVPSANAQPVSASAPNAYPGDAGWDVDAQGNPIPSYGNLTGAMSKAPWNYGPRQNPSVTARMRNRNNYG